MHDSNMAFILTLFFYHNQAAADRLLEERQKAAKAP